MLETFIFVRAEGWYPVQIPREDVAENVRLNPGTLRVEDARGTVVWRGNAGADVPRAASSLGGPTSDLEQVAAHLSCEKGGASGSIWARPDGPLLPHEVQALAFLLGEPHRLDTEVDGALAAAMVFADLASLGLVAIDSDEAGTVITLLDAGRAALKEQEARDGR